VLENLVPVLRPYPETATTGGCSLWRSFWEAEGRDAANQALDGE
jgi:hypothetical protein